MKNPYVATLASGQSAPGFLEFMGSNAVQTGKVKISFDFSSDPESSYIDEMYACDKDVNGTIDGYEVQPCTCNYCEAACKPNEANAYPGFFDGFDWVVVIIVYVALIVLSVIIYFVKKRLNKGDSEPSDSYEVSEDSDRNNGSKQRLISGDSSGEGMTNSKAKINKSSVKEDSLEQNS